MHRIPRLAVAIAASLSLTVALAVQPAYAAPKSGLTSNQARAILIRAARHHGLNPNFVLAVSYWESGWNQTARLYARVSRPRVAASPRQPQQPRRQRRVGRRPVAVVPGSAPRSEAGPRRLLP